MVLRRAMANRATIKIGPAIDAKLYKEFVAVAKENGQSQRFLLEKAIEHYIRTVVPSQRTVRPEVMEAFRRSNEKFQDLYRKLAEKMKESVYLTAREVLPIHHQQIDNYSGSHGMTANGLIGYAAS